MTFTIIPIAWNLLVDLALGHNTLNMNGDNLIHQHGYLNAGFGSGSTLNFNGSALHPNHADMGFFYFGWTTVNGSPN